MPFVEVLTVEVGSAIAKYILKLWLRDSSLVSDVSLSIADVLKSRTSDALAQRRGQRQFDTIGEKVAESLFSVFEIEGASLDEGSRKVVALAVAETLNIAGLSTELLAHFDLEPLKLAKHLRDANPGVTKQFNAVETSLYDRIIKESCEYIVDIASQLPVFTEHTFAEVLKREGQLLNLAEQILQEVRHLREQHNTETEAARFEIAYRRAIVRNLDILELFGTDVALANRRHRLSVAYVTLSIEQKTLINGMNDYHSKKLVSSVRDSSRTKRINGIMTVNEALEISPRLLIRGLAGSGKTTLLQWIAVRSASQSFEGQLSGWNNTIPFFIRLRSCIHSGLPAPESFPKLITSAIADTMPKGWVHAILESGRAIVLIDGLDEVPAAHRREVHTWLEDLVTSYPKSRFIITTRPHTIKEGWMDYIGFHDTELQPMGISDIRSFIDHWHDAVKEELREEIEKEELPTLAQQLKMQIERNHSIRSLATSPLLCAMLCALNRDRHQYLPSDRIELYEACCLLLIDRRDKERGMELLQEYPTLTYRQKRVLLKDLAYWLIKNGWSEVSTAELDQRFNWKLTSIQDISPSISGNDVRRLFVERSGIIREPVNESIDFTHRTFQEFLAAQAILDEGDIGVIMQNARNDQWREVIILTSGLATRSVREKIIQGLINLGDKEQKYRHQHHLLAVSCLETSDELSTDMKLEVEKRLSKLIPPKNMTDAKAMASAGELAVQYLSNKKGLSVSIAAACVRTLALIGTDMALETLKGYTLDTRLKVIEELVKAWDFFNRETYARRILSQVSRSSSLQLPRLPSLIGVHYLTQLSSLSLSDCGRISDLSPLANLTQLTSLNLLDCGDISDLSPLANLTQLTSLNLSYCGRISDLSPLADLTQLTSLNLSYCGRISDLSPLANLTQLTSLNLSYCGGINDLSSVANLTQLTSLDLSHCKQIKNLSPLSSLTQLTSLNLSYCGDVNNLSPLANLKQLVSLDLSGYGYRSLNALVNLTKMISLDLRSCNHISDLRALGGLTQLTSLDLSYCDHISDLSPLGGLTQLTSLDLSYCYHINDLDSLGSLTELTSLDLTACYKVKNINALAGLQKLQKLTLLEIYFGINIPAIIRENVEIIKI